MHNKSCVLYNICLIKVSIYTKYYPNYKKKPYKNSKYP